MAADYKDGKYRISIADNKQIQNKAVKIVDENGDSALDGKGGGGAGMDVVELSSLTGTMTSEQAALVASDHCIVKHDGDYYYKDTETQYRKIGEDKNALEITGSVMNFEGTFYYFVNDSDNRPSVNPYTTEVPIATLEKVQIGYDTFSIPQGTVKSVTVGTTTTGAAGTNASVSNSGTSTAPVLDFTIPRGADAVNPFKGWWPDLATLKAAITAEPGDSAYVKDASPATTWSIYVYSASASSANYWADSGTDADTSNVQTFETSEQVNQVSIVNDLTTGGEHDVLSAEQGHILDGRVNQLEEDINGSNRFDVTSGEKIYQAIDSNGKWGTITEPSWGTSYIVPITPGETYTFVNNSDGNDVIAFLKTDAHVANTTANFSSATGFTSRIVVNLGVTVSFVAPSDSNYLFILAISNGQSRLSDVYTSMSVGGIKKDIGDLQEEMDGITTSIEKVDSMLVYPVINDSEKLSIKINNNENTAWTWWFYPQIVSLDTWRKKAWWGFTDNNGYVGVCEYNAGIKTCWKNMLKFSSDSGFGYLSDDHNNSMVCILPDGKIGAVFASGHEKDERVFVRKSKMSYSIYDFDNPIEILFGGKTTYIQYFYENGKHYLFARCTMSDHYEWQYSESTDFINWSAPTTLIVAGSARYYICLRKVIGSNLIRLVCYGHPISSTDSNIRMGFIDLINKKILNADASTVVTSFGSSFNYSDLSIIVPIETGKVNRLFDVAVTDISTWKVAYAVFTKTIKTDSLYKVSIDGVVNSVCQGGNPFWTAAVYLGGVSFLPDGRIVVSRNDTIHDYIEIYDFSGSAWGVDVEIWKEVVGATPIRNIRPIVDGNGLFVVWQRGRFTDTDHTGDYDLDSMVYDLTSESLFGLN